MLEHWLSIILYQIITVNQTQPCFLNDTAGIDIWQNCGVGTDYLKAVLLPWDWITGGNFSLVVVSVFVIGSYLKYQKAIYSILVGVLFIPVSYFVFPTQWLWFALVIAGVTCGILVIRAYIDQTNEQ